MSELLTLEGFKFRDGEAHNKIDEILKIIDELDGSVYDNAVINSLRRKILAISGGLYNFNKQLADIESKINGISVSGLPTCKVSEIIDSTSEGSVRIVCGSTGTTVKLHLRADNSYTYKAFNIDGIVFAHASLYASQVTGSQVLQTINIDGTDYDSTDVLALDFEFRELCMVYTSSSSEESDVTITTTFLLNPEGMTVIETVEDDYASILPQGFLTASNDRIKAKSVHGSRFMSFGLASGTNTPYNLFTETVEINGGTSIKHISFKG